MRTTIVSLGVLAAALVVAVGAFGATINCTTAPSVWCNGTGGDDVMHSNDNRQSLNGYGGGDRLYGNDGNDLLVGQKGKDRLEGNWDYDDLFGGLSADTILGGYGNDWVNTGCRRAATMYASYCSEWQAGEAEGWYDAGPGNDYVITVNGKYDSGTCGPGFDRANIDFQDTLGVYSFVDCEDIICYGCPSGTQARGVNQTLTVVTEEQMIATVNGWRAEWEQSAGLVERPPGDGDD